MDMHAYDSLLRRCQTSNDHQLSVLSQGIGDLFPTLWTHYMIATWRIQLLGERPTKYEECYALWRDISPRWHVATWFPIQWIRDSSRTPRAQRMFLQGVANLVEYFDLEDKWSLWRLIMEWCGLALHSYITLESFLCMTLSLEHVTSNLQLESLLCIL